MFKSLSGTLQESTDMKKLTIEDMENIGRVDISSFKSQKTLEPQFWTPQKQLDPDIAARLRKIATEFFEGLDLPGVQITDITFTGSLANYNWSTYSDVDVHIVVDFDAVDENEKIVREMFNAKKALWNRQHDIRILGYEVELYVENVHEEHTSSGVYSLLRNGWVVEPERKNPSVDWLQVKTKAASLMDQIDRAKTLHNNHDYKDAYASAVYIKNKLKNYRKAGLDTEAAEYSVENLAFKVLRRNGFLGDLSDVKTDSYDAMMSIKDKQRPSGAGTFYEQEEPPQDTGKFQRAVKAKHKRNRLTTKGKRRKSAPFSINPPTERGKSAPPMEEKNKRLNEHITTTSEYWNTRWDWLNK